MTDREIIERIESLPVDEQNDLFELIRKRRIEQRRTEIAEVGERLRQEVRMGTAQEFENVEDLKSYLQTDSEDEVHYPGNISPIPIVNFHLISLEFPLLITSTDLGILDTGCDVTPISYKVASKLQLEFSGRKKPILTKSSNQIVMGVPFRVDVSFMSWMLKVRGNQKLDG